jgi:hypothetical protein
MKGGQSREVGSRESQRDETDERREGLVPRVQGQVKRVGFGWSEGSCGQVRSDRGQWKEIGVDCRERFWIVMYE